MKRAWARVREFEMRKTTQGLFSRTSRYFSTTSSLPARIQPILRTNNDPRVAVRLPGNGPRSPIGQ